MNDKAGFEEELRKVRTALELEDGESVDALKVVYGGLWAGADAKAVCELTGLSEEVVAPLAANLEVNGVWRGGATVMGPEDPETFGIELLLMVLCAEGKVRRASA